MYTFRKLTYHAASPANRKYKVSRVEITNNAKLLLSLTPRTFRLLLYTKGNTSTVLNSTRQADQRNAR